MLNNELVEEEEEPIEVTFKLTEEQNPTEDVADVPFDYLEDDPYLATAIEFMYSEDTEQDFNSMDRKMQEKLLKKTWMDRERMFYGEEEIEDNCIEEKPEQEEQEESSDEDLNRGDHQNEGQNLVEEILQEEEEA